VNQLVRGRKHPARGCVSAENPVQIVERGFTFHKWLTLKHFPSL
jgi:hypothetical protein